MKSGKLNPQLKVGDKVILLHMEDEYGNNSPGPGTKGVVTRIEKVFGVVQYGVKWEDGSTLSLLSDVDAWKLDEKDNEVKSETFKIKKKSLLENHDELFNQHKIFSQFNMKFLNDYLRMIRDSSITNMFGASPLLYIGRKRMEHEFLYKDKDEDAFEKVLENADKAQQEMINGVIKILKGENKEITVEAVNRGLQKYAPKVLSVYMSLF